MSLLCPSCSSRLIKWGKSRSGKQRFYCCVCGQSRLRFGGQVLRRRRMFLLFREYVLYGATYERLAYRSDFSIRYLWHWFSKFLDERAPDIPKFDQTGMETAYLLIDGLWFGRYFVLMVYRQSKNLLILKISTAKREVGTKIAKDLKALVALDYRFSGIVSDDGTGIGKAVKEVFPHVPHQICLAHMHRRAISMLGAKPKEACVQELKTLADWVWKIESQEALRWWVQQLLKWDHENFDYLQEYRVDQTGHWWYVHKGTRKALNVLLEMGKVCFTFLSHPGMPKTTNEIEAQFGHLGKRWQEHQGLKKTRWQNFLSWFVYFYNQKKLAERKREKA